MFWSSRNIDNLPGLEEELQKEASAWSWARDRTQYEADNASWREFRASEQRSYARSKDWEESFEKGKARGRKRADDFNRWAGKKGRDFKQGFKKGYSRWAGPDHSYGPNFWDKSRAGMSRGQKIMRPVNALSKMALGATVGQTALGLGLIGGLGYMGLQYTTGDAPGTISSGIDTAGDMMEQMKRQRYMRDQGRQSFQQSVQGLTFGLNSNRRS